MLSETMTKQTLSILSPEKNGTHSFSMGRTGSIVGTDILLVMSTVIMYSLCLKLAVSL